MDLNTIKKYIIFIKINEGDSPHDDIDCVLMSVSDEGIECTFVHQMFIAWFEDKISSTKLIYSRFD